MREEKGDSKGPTLRVRTWKRTGRCLPRKIPVEPYSNKEKFKYTNLERVDFFYIFAQEFEINVRGGGGGSSRGGSV